MKVIAFRITNFRSISDTGWCNFSPDNVTVLVGQNESGKTSILDALSKTFSDKQVSDDDCRILAPLPAIYMRVAVEWPELRDELLEGDEDSYPAEDMSALQAFMKRHQHTLDVSFKWERTASASGGTLTCSIAIEAQELSDVLAPFAERATQQHAALIAKYDAALSERTAALLAKAKETDEEEDPDSIAERAKSELGAKPGVPAFLEPNDVSDAVFAIAPTMVLFEATSGLLPDRADLTQTKNGEWQLAGDGAVAAQNFLQIADVNLDDLVRGDVRARENILRRANSRVTADFATFWSQTIGKREKLQLECEIGNYGADQTGKAGKPHLTFWISDGLNKLYPKQRSQGVRWFVSFYLQLKASEKAGGDHMFLLDEPGANLHSKAQADVLRLINQLRTHIGIVYSTHSPHLLEYEKLFRVLAIQRAGEEGDSPTTVIDAHKLGAASRDTLSPLLTAMGVDLSHQQVIQKRANVILEEISGFYYIRAFWKMVSKQDAHFIAATGADNVEPLANMFLGWGLEFIAVLDDDQHGRTAYNRLKRHMFGDDENTAQASLYKIADCRGVEDVFSRSDFQKHVLLDSAEYDSSNSEHVKESSLSKPVLAYRFAIRSDERSLKLENFDAETRGRISGLVEQIALRLYPKQKLQRK